MKTIVAHGYLRELLPDPIRMSGETVQEIIEGLCLQTRALHPKPGQRKHQIRIAGFDTVESLILPIPDDVTEIHLVPELSGGKSGGFVKIALGAVLIGAGLAFPGTWVALGAMGSITGAAVFWGGVTLALGGLLEILSPAPKMDTKPAAQDPEASKYLGAPQNTTKAGTRIPLLYGEHQGFGHYLSFDIDARDVAAGDSSSSIKPALTGSNLWQTVDIQPWDAPPFALSAINVVAPEGIEAVTATLTMPNPDLGSLSTGANSSFNELTGTWTATGSEEEVNAALAAVTYTPPGSIVPNFTIAVKIEASGATALSGEIAIVFRHAQGE